MREIIIIDDEQYIGNIIREALSEFRDFRIHNFTDPVQAEDYIAKNGVDLVLTDLVMGNYSGVHILETTLANHPDAIVILMTGFPTVKTAIAVLKKGGYDYLIKPFKLEDLKSAIKRGLEHQTVRRENVALRSQIELMKVADAHSRGMKLHPFLKLIIDSAVKVIPAEFSAVLLRDRLTQKYSLQCSQTREGEWAWSFPPSAALTLPEGDKIGLEPTYINDEFRQEEQQYKRSVIYYPLMSRGETLGLLVITYIDRFNHISPGQLRLISLLAASAANAVDSGRQERNLRKSYLMTIRALANAVEARDICTAGHTDRVFRLARVIARKLGWDKERLGYLKTGCILHDIGKIGVPDAILNKPGELTAEERKTMEKHPELGMRILAGIPSLEPVLPYIISHHERYDGKGYPYGLQGEDIPIEGRLLAVVDTFDAILSNRPYRQGTDAEAAVAELLKNRGTQFDPMIVDLFMEAYREGKIAAVTVNGREKRQTVSLNPV